MDDIKNWVALHLKNKISPLQFISIGYLITILIGTFFLCLPISNKDGKWVPFLNSLFTSTSATCVTGLVVYDTFTKWTLFGQIIILTLIQIGGLGFMTVITVIMMIMKKNLGLYERTILIQSAGTFSFQGIIRLIKRIMLITFLTEFIGALLFSIQFIQDFGIGEGIWYSIWHSVSAYCNAGFDLMGRFGKFSSLVPYKNNPLVILTASSLILIGGLGFLVYSDLFDNKFKFKDLTTHSKIVIVYGLIITIIPIFLFMGLEWNYSLKGENFGQKLLGAAFMSISPRTAGFNAYDAYDFSQGGLILTIMLMFVGGNSGSTAGGVKVTTVVVVLQNLYCSAKGKHEVSIFKRKINNDIIKQSSALVILYIIVTLISALIICACEGNVSLVEALYETVSGLSTVGLTMGITSHLQSWISKLLLIFLMYAGRIGALTLFTTFIKRQNNHANLKLVDGKILVG